MTGGDFELASAFWVDSPTFGLGDMNCDENVNAYDIDAFVALVAGR